MFSTLSLITRKLIVYRQSLYYQADAESISKDLYLTACPKTKKSNLKIRRDINKRSMGHIAHLRKQFKSINTYDYIINLIKRRKKKPIINFIELIGLNKLESPSPKDALCQVWLKLAHWFWRRRWKCEKFTDGQTDGQKTDDR